MLNSTIDNTIDNMINNTINNMIDVIRIRTNAMDVVGTTNALGEIVITGSIDAGRSILYNP